MEAARWRTSSYTNGAGGAQCVELTYLQSGGAVRDSKHPTGPALVLDSAAWAAFLSDARQGVLDV